jgi:hypothetical protein
MKMRRMKKVIEVKYPAAQLRGIQFSKKLSSPLIGED